VSITVCLSANTLYYPEGGGHQWVYLNWALGLRSLGCRVVWLEVVGIGPKRPVSQVRAQVAALKQRLDRYGLAGALALCSQSPEPLPPDVTGGSLDLGAAAEADLLLDLRYDLGEHVVGCFPRSAQLDIDPGLLQVCLAQGTIRLARHDVYFTTGETVGQPGARFLDAGLRWDYTPPCVALDWWPPRPPGQAAAFTTVSHWYMDEWVVEQPGEYYRNDKRSGFVPFLDLPRYTAQRLELALCLERDGEECAALEARGWHVRESAEVAATPWDYQRYVQAARGEFSCAKPHCIRLQNAWVSDRTLCYLASGKPAVVQHTGPSRFLPDRAGLLRFRTLDEAASCLEEAASDYERHCRLARALAEEFFDARKVAARVLERALA